MLMKRTAVLGLLFVAIDPQVMGNFRPCSSVPVQLPGMPREPMDPHNECLRWSVRLRCRVTWPCSTFETARRVRFRRSHSSESGRI